MVKVLTTNSGFHIALPDDATLTPDEVRSYKAQTYNNPKVHERYQFKKDFPKADAQLTKVLMTELTTNIPQPGKSVNELADDSDFRKHVLEIDKQTGRQHCYTHYTISSSDLPSDYASCNVPLLREEEFYFPKYDSKKQRYVCYNESGSETKINSCRAAFNFKKMEITVYDKAFFFTPKEIETIKKFNQLKRKGMGKEILNNSKQDLALYAFYLDIEKHYLDKNQKLYSVSHELQHAQTLQRINQRRRQQDYKELTPTDMYRFDEDNEKAAHLRETQLAIAKFFKSKGDLSVFPKKCQWIVDNIKNMNLEAQKKFLLNNELIVNGNINNWNKNYADQYIEQRFSLARDHAYDAPVLRMDNSDKEYLARRSCAYTMDVYNPKTGKMEKQDLSKFIKIPTVIREAEREKVKTCEDIRSDRLRKLKQNGIDQKLVSSLLKGTYQEPFKTQSQLQLEEKILEQGFSFKSKNSNGNPILITVKKDPQKGRPNIVSFTASINKQEIFKFMWDRDSKEYNCIHNNTNKKYSNVKGTKHPPLPDDAIKQVQKYMKEARQAISQKITLILANGGNHL